MFSSKVLYISLSSLHLIFYVCDISAFWFCGFCQTSGCWNHDIRQVNRTAGSIIITGMD